ncbi:MAG TPA: HAD-IA family hydrolase [Burkholderiales bacterium]|nr:HAD-IA family hydrolase [Burkholderiales bacterium]
MSYRLIVFDWDGTILDSPAGIAEAIQASCGALGLEVPDRDKASHVIGLGLPELMRTVAPALPVERYPEFIDAYRRHFRAREPSMQLFPGMRELLESLSAQFILGIATAKSRRGLERALDTTGLRPHFRASRCADETHPKPHPAMLLEIMEETGIDSKSVLMIGDTSHDMEMARAAGVAALAVSYGAHREATLRACSPVGCFSSVRDLSLWLKTNA